MMYEQIRLIETDVSEEKLDRFFEDRTIMDVEDDTSDGVRHSLKINFTNGSYIELTACGCCNGISARAPLPETEVQKVARQRREGFERRLAEEDRENAAQGLI